MNKVCYTALFSAYEELKNPRVPQTGFDFVCFTDQPLKSDIWKIVRIEPDLPSQRMARKVKLLPHVYLPEYRYTFWLDAAFQINVNLNDFWNRHFVSPLTAPAHPIRNCIYREIESCIANKRDDESLLIAQREAYKKQEVPSFQNNIITSGVLMREKTPGCVNMCNQWWAELCKYSARDQVAFARISKYWPWHSFKFDYSQSHELKYIRHYKYRH